MKLTPRSRARESGSLLLSTIALVGVIGIALVSFLQLVNYELRATTRSQTWNLALPAVEAGIEEALSQLKVNNSNLATAGWQSDGTNYVKTNSIFFPKINPAGKIVPGQWQTNGSYVARISVAKPYVIDTTGTMPMPGATNLISRRVRVSTVQSGIFTQAAGVKNLIDAKGNDLVVDSYDSRSTNKSTLGIYDPKKAGDKGDVVATDGLVNTVSVGNANIWGHVYTGPLGKVTTGPGGAVGSVAWQNAGKSGVEPGWWQTDFNFSFPPVQQPFASAPSPPSATISKVTYDYVLGNGNWFLGSVAGGKMLVTGNAVLYVAGAFDLSGSKDQLALAPGASVEIYVAGSTARLASVSNPNTAATSVILFGLPTCTDVRLSGVGNFYGAIYAPDAALKMSGGTVMFGACVVASTQLNGNGAIHYDEALGGYMGGPSRPFTISNWEEL